MRFIVILIAIFSISANADNELLSYPELTFFVMKKDVFEKLNPNKGLMNFNEIKINSEIAFICGTQNYEANKKSTSKEYLCKTEHSEGIYKAIVDASYTVHLAKPSVVNYLKSSLYKENEKILSFGYENNVLVENKSLESEYVVYYGPTNRPFNLLAPSGRCTKNCR